MAVAAGVGLVAAAAQVSIPLGFTPVPLSGQTFAVLLVGASLGLIRGAFSLTLYLLSGLVLPFYAGGEKGWDVMVGADGGYIVGFIVAAAVTGFLAQRGWARRFSTAVGAMLTGNVIIYIFGLGGLALALNTNFERTLELGLYPFVLGDLLKLYLAALLLPTAWRVVSRLRGKS